ncbi:MAG: ABC transporter permease [Acidothermus sp.]|nr:ABC transporter permease [Acidothermus sp.]
MNLTYVRYEILRMYRNRRYFVISLAVPLLFFYLVAGNNRDVDLGGIPFPTYYLAGMMAFGTMGSMVSAGGRIATERVAGWNRLLRLTPLRTADYFQAKVLSAYVMAFTTIVALFLAGLTLGVSLPFPAVFGMVGLVLVALIPFAALGILLGHLLTPETMGPVAGFGVAVLAFLGGAWGPIGGGGLLHHVSQAIPTYWLVQAGRLLLGQHAWSATGWFVVAAWSVVLSVLAGRAYLRDTRRV